MTATPEDNAASLRNITQIIVTISVPIMLGAIGWFGTKVLAHENQITSIHASRFTAKDGSDLQRELSVQLLAIHDGLHKLDVKIPDAGKIQSLELAIQQLKLDVTELRADLRVKKRDGT